MSAARVVLVTGATGAVGSAIVPRLLAESETRVVILLRADSDAALAPRVGALIEYWGDTVDPHAVSKRLTAIRGDVAQERLGLGAQQYTALAEIVTNIVHSAGNVKLNQSIDSARASALTAIGHVVEFARACASLRDCPKIEHLSTVGVAGRRPGLIAEEPLENRHGYHNTYEQAKAEAETMLLAEIAAGLPATIHRPSMVVGDARDGRIIHFQVFYYLARFLAGSRTRGILPAFGDVKLDLVPADYVAQAVVSSINQADSAGRIFHLCSGPAHAAPLAEIGATVRRFLHAQGERTFTPHHLPRGLMRAGIRVASVAGGSLARSLATLPYFLDYLDEAQIFSNAQTNAFFAPEGLVSPPNSQFLPDRKSVV